MINWNIWIAFGSLWAIGTVVGLFIMQTRNIFRILKLAADMAWVITVVAIAIIGMVALLERGPELLSVSSDFLVLALIAVILRAIVLTKENLERTIVQSKVAEGGCQ